MKRGVLLMAYGAPNSLDEVEAFYLDIRKGRKPTPEQLHDLIRRYRAIGGVSPLLDITNRQAAALDESLGDGFKTYVGMRHWNPRIYEVIPQMADDGIEEAIAIVMAPHYSRLSIGIYMELVDEAVSALDSPVNFHKIEHWHTQADYITALEARLREGVRRFEDHSQPSLAVIFTAHSLPEKILGWKDLYHNQLLETSWLLADRIGLKNWHFAYQSAGRTSEPWLGPDILEIIEELKKKNTGSILVCPVGFITDHLEVLYDIDLEAMPHAEKLGMRMERVRMLNDDPLLIDCLAKLARDSFSG